MSTTSYIATALVQETLDDHRVPKLRERDPGRLPAESLHLSSRDWPPSRPVNAVQPRPVKAARRRSPLLFLELLATPSATLRLLYDRVISIAAAAVLLLADRPNTSVLPVTRIRAPSVLDRHR
ncbi:vegetative cell wall protein gp1-like [Iris pallida]|uniref:Vegetative cell wall protein gp1-like n=1 Tax=Iris pallida TaxID=29817 RepID=A0AAX6F1I6_IRIPA|nr:vegetative cell wall protein gp1-like [Iris pallida]